MSISVSFEELMKILTEYGSKSSEFKRRDHEYWRGHKRRVISRSYGDEVEIVGPSSRWYRGGHRRVYKHRKGAVPGTGMSKWRYRRERNLKLTPRQILLDNIRSKEYTIEPRVSKKQKWLLLDNAYYDYPRKKYQKSWKKYGRLKKQWMHKFIA